MASCQPSTSISPSTGYPIPGAIVCRSRCPESFCRTSTTETRQAYPITATKRNDDSPGLQVIRWGAVRSLTSLKVNQPAKKYQNDGGPGARAIVELLIVHSSADADDVNTFVTTPGLWSQSRSRIVTLSRVTAPCADAGLWGRVGTEPTARSLLLIKSADTSAETDPPVHAPEIAERPCLWAYRRQADPVG